MKVKDGTKKPKTRCSIILLYYRNKNKLKYAPLSIIIIDYRWKTWFHWYNNRLNINISNRIDFGICH